MKEDLLIKGRSPRPGFKEQAARHAQHGGQMQASDGRFFGWRRSASPTLRNYYLVYNTG